MARVLTHVCCGPCFTAVHEELVKDHEVAALYHNPNIHPALEWRRRLIYLRRFCDGQGTPLAVAPYEPKQYFAAVHGHEERAERCRRCYEIRLRETAQQAAADRHDAFTTTLLISPFQDHDAVAEVGRALGRLFGVDFLYLDFRPQFKRGQALARSSGMYRQRYCGCVYSEAERFATKIARETDMSK